MNAEDFLRRAYDAFNARDIDTVLTVMHPDVVWPNAMEGGCVLGHAGIGEYGAGNGASLIPTSSLSVSRRIGWTRGR